MDNGKFVIMSENFKKPDSDEEIEGLTVILDGKLKEVFDKIRAVKGYEKNTDIMRDILINGINSIITGK